MNLFGLVLEISLPERRPSGHEQSGLRPCSIVADSGQHQRLNFPQYLVCPITSTMLETGLMRIRIEAGTADLRLPGTILIDQLQAVDVGRVTGAFGRLTPIELEPVRLGLRALLGEALDFTA